MTLHNLIILAGIAAKNQKDIDAIIELAEFNDRWRDLHYLPLEDLLITEAPKPEGGIKL